MSKSKTKANTCFPSMTHSCILRNHFTETLICNSTHYRNGISSSRYSKIFCAILRRISNVLLLFIQVYKFYIYRHIQKIYICIYISRYIHIKQQKENKFISNQSGRIDLKEESYWFISGYYIASYSWFIFN